MGPSAPRRVALVAAFVHAASVYWLVVFPRVRLELWGLKRRALAIPDPVLRQLALETQTDERGNLEGAAAFAAHVPQRLRTAVVQAVVSFQAVYDYVDSLVEQPDRGAAANGRMLHRALDVALCPGISHLDYYAHNTRTEDGGYLSDLVDDCRRALQTLPSFEAVQGSARRAAARIIDYQTLIHVVPAGGDDALDAWARDDISLETGLYWWERRAAGASSLLVIALIAAAAQPSLTSAEVSRLEGAYFPWIGALHVLLDNLIDQPDDSIAGHVNLVEHYSTPQHTAQRMGTIARRAVEAVDALADPVPHALLLVAMTSFYVSSSQALLPHAADAARRVTGTMGDLALPMLLILRMRRGAARLHEQFLTREQKHARSRRLETGRLRRYHG